MSAPKLTVVVPSGQEKSADDKKADEDNSTPLSPKSPNALARRRLSMMPSLKNPLEKVDGHGYEASNELKSPAHKDLESKDNARPFRVFHSLSKTGYVPFNSAKVNQDRFCEVKKLGGEEKKALFGVFDGHGVYGDEVSQFVSTSIHNYILKQKDLETDTVEALKKAFVECNKALNKSNVDSSFSGSTGIACYLNGKQLYSCNTGDSRAVLGQLQKDGSYKAIPLSDDQKPDRPDEKKRIIANQGRVEHCKDSYGADLGPARVWLLHQDVPGLAMSRSFGDMVAASVGVIAEPEVWTREIVEEDKFFVLASDGVWEFISSQEAVDIIVKAKSPEDACQELVKEATLRWKKEEEVIDDITCVIVYF